MAKEVIKMIMCFGRFMADNKLKIPRIRFVLCHRRPDRTLKFKGRYFPVCARCTGIYIGILFLLFSSLFIEYTYSFRLLLIAGVMMFPTAIDGITQLLGFRESINFIRLFTGFFGGIGYAMMITITTDVMG